MTCAHVRVARLILLCLVVTVMAWSDPAQSQTPEPIDLQNWTHHPAIKEVRALYHKINVGVTTGRADTAERMFDVSSTSCASYPIQSEALHRDGAAVVQRFDVTQMASHSELLKIFRYYDVRGVIRFVLIERNRAVTRIYFDREGLVIWAVEKQGATVTPGHFDNRDWETKPSKSDGAVRAFEARQRCPEIVIP